MERWTWMALRAYSPSFAALALAFALTWIASGWQDHPLLSPLTSVLGAVPLGLLVAAIGLGAYTSYRLWRWEQGQGFICECGGMLGRERPGIRDWGRYRRCFACGRNVNHRHYE